MPGASGWPVSLPASSAAAPAGGRARARSRRAAGRRGAAASGASKQPTMVDSTPTSTGAAIDDQVDASRKVALHMRGRGRRNVARQIGRRRHHRPAERAQDVARHRMRGNPDRDRLEPGGGEIGHRAVVCLRQHQRQRPRPERFGKRGRLRVEARNPPGGLDIADMGDQRIERGPALGLIEPRDRGGIGGVGAEAIDGLGRERDQPAFGRERAPPRPRRPRRRAKSVFSGPHSQAFTSSIRLLAVCETQGYKPRSCRSVAQPGRALRSGRRGRRFESCHSDQDIFRDIFRRFACFPRYLQGWRASSLRPEPAPPGPSSPRQGRSPDFRLPRASIAQTCVHDPAAQSVRVWPFFSRPLSKRGRRESRVRAAPAVSRAKAARKRTRAYRFSGGNPAFPAQWFYGL